MRHFFSSSTLSESLTRGHLKSGFQYGKFANNLFSILKLLVTVPKMGKIHHISNMTVWDKMAIFETTAKNSVLERWGPGPDLKYEKKMKKFDLVRILSHNHEIPLFWWETHWASIANYFFSSSTFSVLEKGKFGVISKVFSLAIDDFCILKLSLVINMLFFSNRFRL